MQKKKSNIKNELIKKYCKHLEDGFTPESFSDTEYSVIEDMASNDEKLKGKIKSAKRKGRHKLEKICLEELFDDVKKFNSRLWMFVMKNKYGWSDKPADKKDSEDNRILKVKLGFEDGREFENFDS